MDKSKLDAMTIAKELKYRNGNEMEKNFLNQTVYPKYLLGEEVDLQYEDSTGETHTITGKLVGVQKMNKDCYIVEENDSQGTCYTYNNNVKNIELTVK